MIFQLLRLRLKWWDDLNSHLESIDKAGFQVLFHHLPKKLSKTMKNINHNSQFLGAAILTWYLQGTKQE
jgi:hypothetical protein